MARKITQEAISAFMKGDSTVCNGYGRIFNKDNTVVTRNKSIISLHLHNNCIARREVGSNQIEVSNGGWSSNTTKERLNGIPGVSVCQRKGVWYLNGEAWNGEWKKI